MPVTLKLFGGMVLENSHGALTGQITQRRRLAFLAILGAGSRATVSRDRLVALLWPELDAEGARHRLSDCLYVARRALGEGAIVPMGDDLRLDDAHVQVDVREFERALDAGETENAIALYTGPFLDGFHLGGEGEFDRWVEEERARLSGRFVQGLRVIAAAAEQHGHHAAAAESLRRLAAHDPLDARVTLQLMRALERSGNGTAALRHARVHQALRQSELGLGDEPEIRAVADALIERLSREAHAEPVAHGANEEAPVPNLAPPPRRGARKWAVIAAIAAAAAIVTVALLAKRKPGLARESPVADAKSSAADSAATAVAVFPFLVRGGDSTDITGDALASVLSTKLDGGAGLRSIDPNALLERYHPDASQSAHPDPADAARLARGLGARYFVLGDVVRAEGQLHLGAALYDATSGAPVETRVGVEGKNAAFFELVDSLAARLLVEQRGQPVPQLAKLASLTTGSLSALKWYLDGESLAREGRFAEAAERFERAAAADSTFGLAYYRLAWTHEWIPGAFPDAKNLELASRYAERLPERIRVTLSAALALSRGDMVGGEAKLRGVVARYPDDFDATYRLGDLLYHQNPPRGRSAAEAREVLERASRLSPARSAEALYHLIAIAALEHRPRDVDSLSSLFFGLQQGGTSATGIRGLIAVMHKDSSRLALVRRELSEMRPEVALRIIALLAGAVPGSNEVTQLLASLDGPQRSPSERARILIALAQSAGARGAWRPADSLFTLANALDSEIVPLVKARFLSLPSLEPPVALIRDAQSALASVHAAKPDDVARASLLAGLLALRLGDLEAARLVSERYAVHAPDDSRVRALRLELAARRLLRMGMPDKALAILVAADAPRPDLPLRFLRAEVLEALGRRAEALAWYDVSAQDYGGEWYAAAIARARERLSPAR